MTEPIDQIDLEVIARGAAASFDPNTHRTEGPISLPRIDPSLVDSRIALGRTADEIAAELLYVQLCVAIRELGEGQTRRATLFQLQAGTRRSEQTVEVARRLTGAFIRSMRRTHSTAVVTFGVPDHDTFVALHLLLGRSPLKDLVRHHAGSRPYDSITISW